MSHDAQSEYLRNAVMTATPEQLQMMLYDGAIRFARQAREALERRDFETSCERLIRAQNIVTALENGLRPEVNASLCEQLAALYGFIFRRLVDANMHRDIGAVDDALRILEHQRETWRLLMDKLRGVEPAATSSPAGAPAATRPRDLPGSRARTGSSNANPDPGSPADAPNSPSICIQA